MKDERARGQGLAHKDLALGYVYWFIGLETVFPHPQPRSHRTRAMGALTARFPLASRAGEGARG
ncbi:hypothetical protein JOD20_004658 [Herpetosiphon giganteus]|nr:hypothetical protein [Herpetosiphon giganteus]